MTGALEDVIEFLQSPGHGTGVRVSLENDPPLPPDVAKISNLPKVRGREGSGLRGREQSVNRMKVNKKQEFLGANWNNGEVLQWLHSINMTRYMG